jgi:hypothetical protein
MSDPVDHHLDVPSEDQIDFLQRIAMGVHFSFLAAAGR